MLNKHISKIEIYLCSTVLIQPYKMLCVMRTNLSKILECLEIKKPPKKEAFKFNLCKSVWIKLYLS